jgi:hypothetical protein
VEEGALVVDLAGGDVFELGGEFGGAFAAVGFDDADDDVFAALAAADAFGEHAEGLADAGSVAEKDLEAAAGLFLVGGDEPVFGTLPRCGIGRQVVVSPCELTAGSGSISMVGGGSGADRNCSVYHLWLHVNPTTVALTLLLLVLFLAARWGLRYAVATSIAATLAYNFYFLPPIGTLTISDPQNWLGIFVFLTVAVVGSRLSERAREEAEDARRRQRELEVLYGLSRQLLQTENVAGC